MNITRRVFVLTSLFASTAKVLAQGVASRSVKPQAKPLPSGRPFDAQFVDVAHDAGLILPVIYGDPDNTNYILEAVGCGCAFFDYDNDGWMDIFVLTGTRMSGAPPRPATAFTRTIGMALSLTSPKRRVFVTSAGLPAFAWATTTMTA